MLGRNPRPRITHGETNAILDRCRGQLEFPSLRRVSDRIGAEVLQRLLEPLRITGDGQRFRTNADVHGDVSIANDWSMAIGHAAEQVDDRHAIVRQRAAASLEPREIQEIADHRFELLRFVTDDRKISVTRFGIERQLRHRQCFRVATNRCKGRHQLVRDVCEQLPPCPIRFREGRRSCAQVVRHPVERASERGHFVTAGLLRAHVGAPFPERRCRLLQRTEALVRRPEDDQRHDRRPGDEQRRGDPGQGRSQLPHDDRRRRGVSWNRHDAYLSSVNDDRRNFGEPP